MSTEHFDALKIRIRKQIERTETALAEQRKQLSDIERLEKLSAPSQLDLAAETTAKVKR